MANPPPTLIAIEHDDFKAKYVGRIKDGRQFFLTTPFEPAFGNNAGREFLALYLFDAQGKFLEAHIDDLGTRAELSEEYAYCMLKQRIVGLGKIKYCRIEVEPFQVERFGTSFGLIPHLPEDDSWWVEVQPGNYMAFSQPWDSGWYDT